ncbi:MAG: glutamine amidotransferase [Candidatus Caldatribacteriaceae bacterium]
MVRALYVGDASALIGPQFIQSPYLLETKGFSVNIWCKPVLDALNADSDIEVVHMPAWVAHREFPSSTEELAKFNVVILSDVEKDVILLYHDWTKAPMGPNRLKVIKDFVYGGGGLIMIGGWSSFTGRFGMGGYHGTPVEEALPVECLPIGDDREEKPEGVWIEAIDVNHPIMKDIPWGECPCFLGYNKLKVKPGAKVLAQTKDENKDPFIVVWDYGKGKGMAFASDISPHWAIAFMKWEYYPVFWRRVVKWLAGAL